MNKRRNVVAMLLTLTAMPGFFGSQAQNLAAPKPNVVLVELFTSEGCSSCPPADALLGQVNGTETHAGQLIVGISEHVTYWNALGWSDPFSSPTNTERQNDYGERFHLEGVYTPQMVINGSEQIVGSDRAAFERALQKEEQKPLPLSLRILAVNVVDDTVTVSYTTSGMVPTRGADLIAVVADDSDRSSVLRGENSGRTLAHVAVARSITRVARVQAVGEHSLQMKLPASFQRGQKHHLILFAQTPGSGPVLGIDTKPL